MSDTVNYQRRDFMRRALYLGLSMGLPQPVLAALGDDPAAELWQHKMAATEALEARMLELFRECFAGPPPDMIICGTEFYEEHGEEFEEAGYEHEVVTGA